MLIEKLLLVEVLYKFSHYFTGFANDFTVPGTLHVNHLVGFIIKSIGCTYLQGIVRCNTVQYLTPGCLIVRLLGVSFSRNGIVRSEIHKGTGP